MKIKKPTKTQRHTIYKAAKEFYISCLNQSMPPGMCYALYYNYRNGGKWNTYDYPELFKEFIAFRPNISDSQYWWDRWDSKPRIEAFDMMIAQTAKRNPVKE